MLQQMCRTCLATHGELVPIFTNNYYVHNLPDKLKHTIRIEVSKDDDLPQMMCKKCVFLVDSLYCFKDQCEMAEVKLKKSLLKSQVNNKRKPGRPRKMSLEDIDFSKEEEEEDYSNFSSSEDEYHVEYASEEARQAVEDAKRLRRNAKKKQNSHVGVKVKSVEILPTLSKNSSYSKLNKSASYQYEDNEEGNVSDSDISSSYCMSEDSRRLPNKISMFGKQQKSVRPDLKRKIEMNNSYSQLTKVPKKVMFKETEFEDDTHIIELAENPKVKKDAIPTSPGERTLPSTKIDDKVMKKKISSFSISPKTSNNSMSSTDTSKSARHSDSKRVTDMRMQSLIKHVVLNNPKSCTICSDSFDTYLGMLRHRVQMHMNPEDKCFYCPICQEKFYSYKLLISHVTEHKNLNSFMCVLCSENFYTEEVLRAHLATHVNLTELTCIMCSLSFDLLTPLLSHLDEHINKQLVCSFCIDSFGSKDSLQNHISKEHNDTSPATAKSVLKDANKRKPSRVACPHCSRNFTSAAAVKEHISKKHQEFTCLVCDKKFPTQDERNDHTKQFHLKPEQKPESPEKVDKKKFLCRVCHEILISRAAYTQHLKDKHANQTSEIVKDLAETSQSEQPSQSDMT